MADYATRLTRDHLRSITQVLQFREFAIVSRLCRAWNVELRGVTRRESVSLATYRDVDAMLRARPNETRHVATLAVTPHMSQYQCLAVTRCFPQLKELGCTLIHDVYDDDDDEARPVFVFPGALRSLRVRITHNAWVALSCKWVTVCELIRSACAVRTLARLDITLDAYVRTADETCTPGDMMRGLEDMPHLTSLTLHLRGSPTSPTSRPLPLPFYASLGALAHLTFLSVDGAHDRDVLGLLPTTLQRLRLDDVHCTVKMSAVLARFTAFTHLRVAGMSDSTCLRAMPHLRELDLGVCTVAPAQLARDLTPCAAQLRVLCLNPPLAFVDDMHALTTKMSRATCSV
jgi:hypothetical protein